MVAAQVVHLRGISAADDESTPADLTVLLQNLGDLARCDPLAAVCEDQAVVAFDDQPAPHRRGDQTPMDATSQICTQALAPGLVEDLDELHHA